MGKHPFVASLLLGAALSAPLITSGCAVHHYRVYDPYYNDYHHWDDHERVYYNQWTIETHRDSRRDFRDLNHDDQRAYWDWRHVHDNKGGDHDHNHEHQQP